MNNDKKTALEGMIKNLEREHGKGIVIKMDDSFKMEVEVTSSGSLLLDEALGVGGYPRGRVVEVYGPESSGKTTLALHAIAEAQKKGGICAFVDAEHALDMKYARQIGVNPDQLYLSQPENGEQALEIVDAFINSHAIDMIVVDSVAALVPKSEIEGQMGDAQMALQARLMSQALRKITGSLGRTKTTIIFINQLRMKIGVFYGNPETTTGGNALKFYSSVRIDIRKIETLKKGDEIYGSKTRVKVVKNKVAPPFRSAELTIIYGEGISKFQELIDLSVKYDIIKRSGTWYAYKDTRIGQGQDSVRIYLRENPEIFKEVSRQIKKKIAGEAIDEPLTTSAESSKKTPKLDVKKESKGGSQSQSLHPIVKDLE